MGHSLWVKTKKVKRDSMLLTPASTTEPKRETWFCFYFFFQKLALEDINLLHGNAIGGGGI